jgi:carbonic anhydrase/acetyltransferase-like protein (isoleucine patch superfamily)
MPVVPLGARIPRIHPSAFIAPDAWVIGDVEIGEDVFGDEIALM